MYFVENENDDRDDIICDFVWEMSELYVEEKYKFEDEYFRQKMIEKLYLNIFTSEE
ncbi:MAG: hypothetical protein IJ608_14405 [Lachnospiraceae bacterium]|nr:hypothetical protein [Lachnospiraceae bacterium]